MKTKINSSGDKATDFHDREMPKAGSKHTCLAVLTIDSALKKDEDYYLQVFSEECKYIEKEKKLLDILLKTYGFLATLMKNRSKRRSKQLLFSLCIEFHKISVKDCFLSYSYDFIKLLFLDSCSF